MLVTGTFNSSRIRLANLAESRLTPIPNTLFLGNPVILAVRQVIKSTGLVITKTIFPEAYSLIFKEISLIISEFFFKRSSRLIPGLRLIPAVRTIISLSFKREKSSLPLITQSCFNTLAQSSKSRAFPLASPFTTSKSNTSTGPSLIKNAAIWPPTFPAPIIAIFCISPQPFPGCPLPRGHPAALLSHKLQICPGRLPGAWLPPAGRPLFLPPGI